MERKHIYSMEEVRVVVSMAMICFTLLYLAMRLAGVTLSVWW